MNVGEVMAALAFCASGWDDDQDHLLMLKEIYCIDVCDDRIDISFVDGNTPDIRIGRNGKKLPKEDN